MDKKKKMYYKAITGLCIILEYLITIFMPFPLLTFMIQK